MKDIYFEWQYAELCALAEEGKVTEFTLKNEYGKINYLFLLRPILKDGKETGFHDIVSPYGYGGPVIEEEIEGKKEVLLETFKIEFAAYCKENNVVSEFIRFHPIVENALDFKDMYTVIYSRKTVGTNLEKYEDVLLGECSKSCRKHIRQIEKSGVSYKVTYQPESLANFKEIYYSTMERNKASDYYYFSDEYFKKCLENFRENIVVVEAIYEGRTIAMNLCFTSAGTIHIHLSGTLQEYLYLSPAYILRYGLLMWGKGNGYKLIHHGGGRSSAEDDSLYLFKKQFGENTQFDFYIGKKIWNQKAYAELCQLFGKEQDADYFPAYRA